jgi:CPA2 family monovalent cation:H+ antiporter-2
VRTQQELGVPIHYGDATRRAVLEHLGVARARAVVVAIADPAATRQAVAMARSLNSDAYILVRTRLLAEVEPLRQLGASDVVPEEFETSLELAGRLMAVYGATSAAVLREKSRLRRERYDFLRGEERAVPREMETLEDLLGAMDVEIVPLATGHHAVGRSARELRLRNESGATILAVAGRDGLDANPGPDRVLVEGDRVVLGGRADQVRQARSLLESGGTAATDPPAPADEA